MMLQSIKFIDIWAFKMLLKDVRMKKQWILGLMVLSVFAWVGCGPKSIPSEEQAAQEPIDTQDLNFENNNSNNNNQNNTYLAGSEAIHNGSGEHQQPATF